MRTSIVVALVVISRIAVADNKARCAGPGKPCGRLTWQLGAMMERFTPKPIDALATGGDGTTTYHVTGAAGDLRPIVASGGAFRQVLGFKSGLYIASEMDFAFISTGPRLVAEIAERGMISTVESTTGGTLLEVRSGIGYRHRAGPAVLAIDVGPGSRFARFTTHDLPDRVTSPIEAWVLVEAHANAEMFVSPHVSFVAQLATDLLRAPDVSGGVFVGLHMSPYDQGR